MVQPPPTEFLIFRDSLRGVGPRRNKKRTYVGAIWLALAIVTTQASFGAPASINKIEKARQERVAIQAELDKSVAEYEAAEARLDKTRVLLSASRTSLDESEARLEAARARIGSRANLMYREGFSNVFEFLLTAHTFGDFNRRLKLVGKVSQDESAHMRDVKAARTKTNTIRQELTERIRDERELTLELAARTMSLESKFDRATLLEKKLVAEHQAQLLAESQRRAKAAAAAAAAARAARSPAAKAATPAVKAQAAAATPKVLSPSPTPAVKTSGGLRCPVDGPTSFTDTYGQPREGGRRHEGVDMFAAQGTPTVAVTSSVVHRQGSSGAGGISVLLRGENGTDYYYAHLSKFASISVGQKVAAGATIGYVGSTGNASAKAPHLHFEVHPGGGGAINPYPTAKAACS